MVYIIAIFSIPSPCRNFPIFPYFKLGSSAPVLKFPNIEKTGRGAVSTRLVFLDQKKLIGSLSGDSEEFLVSLKYGKSICIWRGPD